MPCKHLPTALSSTCPASTCPLPFQAPARPQAPAQAASLSKTNKQTSTCPRCLFKHLSPLITCPSCLFKHLPKLPSSTCPSCPLKHLPCKHLLDKHLPKPNGSQLWQCVPVTHLRLEIFRSMSRSHFPPAEHIAERIYASESVWTLITPYCSESRTPCAC